MTNFDYVQATIDLFEASLGAGTPITTAGGLASRIGYSVHHLGRLFQSLCGESLGRYMLSRASGPSRAASFHATKRPGGSSMSARSTGNA